MAEEPRIDILNLESFQWYTEGDTLKINYYVVRNSLDSVALIIDDKIRQTQSASANTIIFILERRGSYAISLRLAAYYKSGIVRFSKTYFINVFNLSTPALDFVITRDDGLDTYFVGEKLLITIKAKLNFENLNNFKEISFYLNGENLGTKTSDPFTFTSNVIQKEQNQVLLILKDVDNRIHYVNKDLTVPTNSPPEIKYDFLYRHNIPPGYYFTSESVETVLLGSDNLRICYLDFYLDDTLYAKKKITNDGIVNLTSKIGKLPAGKHSTYCIAFDDREVSTKSDLLNIEVYNDVDLYNDICDVEYSDSEENVFLLSNSKLYILDPVLEKVTMIVDLPFSEAVSMDFVGNENNLYIAFRQGKLFVWNCSAQVLKEVMLPSFSNIEDIEIDNDHNLVLISNNTLLAVNLDSGKVLRTNAVLDSGCTLAYDKVYKLILAGGSPHVSRSYVYLYQLDHDTLIYKKKSDIGGFGYKLQLNPSGVDFTISPNPDGLKTAIKTYLKSDLSFYWAYEQLNASVTSYSTDGNLIFISDNWESILNIYDTKNRVKNKSLPIPLADNTYMNYLLPNKANTRLVVTTTNALDPRSKIIFTRINQ